MEFNSVFKGLSITLVSCRLTHTPAQLPIKWATDLFTMVKAADFEAHLSPPYNVEVKNLWSYTSASRWIFIAG